MELRPGSGGARGVSEGRVQRFYRWEIKHELRISMGVGKWAGSNYLETFETGEELRLEGP